MAGPAYRDAIQRAEVDVVPPAGRTGFAALKTIAAYRGGLRPRARIIPCWRVLEANEETGDPLPVQVHCGFGDRDLLLPLADPGWLKPVIERFEDTPFVLLHCYPFVREAGWLAHVYAERLLRPLARRSRTSRAGRSAPPGARARTGVEAAVRLRRGAGARAVLPRRQALARRAGEVLPEVLPAGQAVEAGRAILRENALGLYRI